MVSTYGESAREIFINVSSIDDLGCHFGLDIYEREIKHTIKDEYVKLADDFLWRRTKLGLFCTEAQTHKISSFIRDNI